MRSKPVGIVLWVIVLFGTVSIVFMVRHLSHPRIIAWAVAPDGTEMCIVQQCNWGAEPFTTSFVYRKPGTNWGWFYYDHQDGYWGKGRAVIQSNRNTAVFYRGESPALTFDWETETYTLYHSPRTLTGAQRTLPAGWSPSLSVYR